MSTNNYFKSNNTILTFDDTNPDSILSAWLKAGDNPSLYRPIQWAGPWDACPIIGHRNIAAIYDDLWASNTTPEDRKGYAHELVELHRLYLEAGRNTPTGVSP